MDSFDPDTTCASPLPDWRYRKIAPKNPLFCHFASVTGLFTAKQVHVPAFCCPFTVFWGMKPITQFAL